MMTQGLLVAMLVSVFWILAQNLYMHIRPADNRFRAMLTGYLLSLPLIFVAYQRMPLVTDGIAEAAAQESWAMGLLHAYLLHLLLFFLYGEFFYYIERSVTLRFFVEILACSPKKANLDEIRREYSLEDMIRQRLDVMKDRSFIENKTGKWQLKTKGLVIARLSLLAARVFRAKGQHERL